MSVDGSTASTDHVIDGEAILRIRGLDAGYGDLQILSGVELDVAEGEYVTIVGPNGAGKSTVMKTVFGLTTHMEGTIEFVGEPIHGEPPERIIRKGIGYVPQNDNVFAGLSVRENLEMGAYILDEVPEERIEAVYDRFPILREREDQKAGNLSGGQRQMVAMGRSLMLDPDLLLLDEPTEGLAPYIVRQIERIIEDLNDQGITVLVVEQNIPVALGVSDYTYILEHGHIVHEGKAADVREDEEVLDKHLGVGVAD